ncbi:C1 family peptidase [Bdellovibrio svalbardensis]|uniref:Cysteine protease n=1 Tax=Bdellovibrio svalbardensis TaxID=2972972 RepID=A0ABT6DKH0_9BACT|nr:hypothetical protein [Bdellovibrio svalbardensis]MDG0817303.1 hypothetical protein [Bdellovibrio svalbardensis]
MRHQVLASFVLSFSLLGSVTSFAAYGLNPFGPEFKPQADTVIAVTNMPRVRSQDTFGICYAFVASTLIDEANCVQNKVSDCSSVSDNDKVSPLDMSRYSQKLSDGTDDTDRFNYEGLTEGGSESFALFNAAFRAQSITRESCAPFDQVVGKVKDPAEAQQLEIAMWTKFKDSYDAYKKKKEGCAQCALEFATATANDIKQDYGLKASNQDILKAFSEDSYGKFLDKILIPDNCWDLKNQTTLKGAWTQNIYPEKGQKSNYASAISKIKEVLTQKRPLSLGFCTQTPLKAKTMADCGVKSKTGKLEKGESHAIVIKGYRRVCNSANKCYDALQIQNSWGESWQNSNDDGWVDAKELLDRSFYETQSMTWLTQQK